MVFGVAFYISFIDNKYNLDAVGSYFGNLFPGIGLLWLIINFFFFFKCYYGLFALIFKILPDVLVNWKDVWSGAIITSLLFIFGKFSWKFI